MVTMSSGMPGFPQRRLTDGERRRLRAAEDAIGAAELRWAELVRELSYAAVARERDVTPEAVRKRVVRILALHGRGE
jgi:hypothetical protein